MSRKILMLTCLFSLLLPLGCRVHVTDVNSSVEGGSSAEGDSDDATTPKRSAGGDADGQVDGDDPASASGRTPTRPDGEPGEAREGGETTGADPATAKKNPDLELLTGEVPSGLEPSDLVAGFPQVVGDKIEVVRAAADLTLDGSGVVLVKFDIELKNPVKKHQKVLVGYVWRSRRTGDGADWSRVNFDGHKAVACTEHSSEKIKQPYQDVVFYIEVEVPSGKTTQVKGAYKLPVRRFDKPETLFGYQDRFSQNWKNWDWPYTKADEYKEIAADLRPFYVRFFTNGATSTSVTLNGSRDALRTMSHEQNITKMRTPGTFAWNFGADDLPSMLSFEYVEGLDIQKEIGAFEKLKDARADDLRARIRLSDLYFFGGDMKERATLLEQTLKIWEKGAKEQMLSGSNDVRGAAYVALVGSLLATDQKAKARRFAKKGLKLIKDKKLKDEKTRLAAAWLKSNSK